MATTLLALLCCLVLSVEVRAQDEMMMMMGLPSTEMTVLPSEEMTVLPSEEMTVLPSAEMTVLPSTSDGPATTSVSSTPPLTTFIAPATTTTTTGLFFTTTSSFAPITPTPASMPVWSTSSVHPALGWIPAIGCLKSDRGTSIKVELAGGLEDFSLQVMNPPTGCNSYLGRFLRPLTVPERCVENSQVEVALQLTHIRQVFGGRYFRHFLFSCSDLGPDGKVQELTVNSNPNETEATAQNSTYADGTFELLVVTGRALRSSAVLTSASTLDWSQDDVFLVLRQLLAPGSVHRTLIPLKCQTSSSSHPNRLTFWFSSPGEVCTQETGLVGDWNIRSRKTATEDVTYCPMFPFDFRPGELVTVTCSIRECPDVSTPAQLQGKCLESYNQYKTCGGKWNAPTRRFRRAISSLAEPAAVDLADHEVSVSFVVA